MTVALATAACDSPCPAKQCPSVGREADPSDYVVELDDSAFAYFEVDGWGADVAVAGEVVFHVEDPNCVASFGRPCPLTLNRLRLQMGTSTLPTTEGDVELRDLTLAADAPLELLDSGAGYWLHADRKIHTCVHVDGRPDTASAYAGEGARMHIDIPNQAFGFDMLLPVVFHIGRESCNRIKASVTVVANGRSPWAQVPP